MSLSGGIIMQSYALGVQGMWVGQDSQVTTVADDAPFGDILSFPNYQVADYQQLYP